MFVYIINCVYMCVCGGGVACTCVCVCAHARELFMNLVGLTLCPVCCEYCCFGDLCATDFRAVGALLHSFKFHKLLVYVVWK